MRVNIKGKELVVSDYTITKQVSFELEMDDQGYTEIELRLRVYLSSHNLPDYAELWRNDMEVAIEGYVFKVHNWEYDGAYLEVRGYALSPNLRNVD